MNFTSFKLCNFVSDHPSTPLRVTDGVLGQTLLFNIHQNTARCSLSAAICTTRADNIRARFFESVIDNISEEEFVKAIHEKFELNDLVQKAISDHVLSMMNGK